MTRDLILRSIYAVLFLVCIAGVVMSTANRPDHTIRLGFLGSTDDEDYDGAMAFKTYVEKQTGGGIAVEVFPSGQFCGNERECIENLQTGVLDVFMTTIGGMGNLYGPGQVFDLPYVFRDDAIAECVFDGRIVPDLRDTMLDKDLGLRLMVVSNTGGWRNFATTTKPVRTPADVRGLKIRTTTAPIQQELMRQLKGNPTPIAWSELYTALATGVVEGTKNGVQDIMAMKFNENIKYITLDGHAYMGALWWYSEAGWSELTSTQQDIVAQGFEDLKEVTRRIPKEKEQSSYDAFRASGGEVFTLTKEEKDAFREATSGMRDWYAGRYGDEWIIKLDAAISVCEQAQAG